MHLYLRHWINFFQICQFLHFVGNWKWAFFQCSIQECVKHTYCDSPSDDQWARKCVPWGEIDLNTPTPVTMAAVALGMTLHVYNNTALAGLPISTNTSAALPLTIHSGKSSAEGTGMLTFPSYGRHVRVNYNDTHKRHIFHNKHMKFASVIWTSTRSGQGIERSIWFFFKYTEIKRGCVRVRY